MAAVTGLMMSARHIFFSISMIGRLVFGRDLFLIPAMIIIIAVLIIMRRRIEEEGGEQNA